MNEICEKSNTLENKRDSIGNRVNAWDLPLLTFKVTLSASNEEKIIKCHTIKELISDDILILKFMVYKKNDRNKSFTERIESIDHARTVRISGCRDTTVFYVSLSQGDYIEQIEENKNEQ